MVTTEKNELADVLQDAWERVIAMEEEWDEVQYEEGLDAEESEHHPLRQRLLAARARLESVRQSVVRDARDLPQAAKYSTPNTEICL